MSRHRATARGELPAPWGSPGPPVPATPPPAPPEGTHNAVLSITGTPGPQMLPLPSLVPIRSQSSPSPIPIRSGPSSIHLSRCPCQARGALRQMPVLHVQRRAPPLAQAGGNRLAPTAGEDTAQDLPPWCWETDTSWDSGPPGTPALLLAEPGSLPGLSQKRSSVCHASSPVACSFGATLLLHSVVLRAG